MKKIFLNIVILFSALSSINVFANNPEPSIQLQAWIESKMQHDNIPGASIAVVKNYQLKWAKGFGLKDKAKKEYVTTNTLFQAASMSKPITAVAVMETFSKKNISLNTNINTILKTWKIPENGYTNKQVVTMKLLLSHSAGISRFRYKGYSIHEKIPTLIEELNGEPPANTPAIIVIRQPGTKYEYSPAGYTIIQQVLEDIYPQPFAEIMQQLILNPLSMQHSTFMSPLPKKYLSDVAMPYLPNGKPLANGPFSFTAAAGGLWTTPTDLAKFLIAIQKALAGEKQGDITPNLIAQMMLPGINHNMGLGFEVNIDKNNKPSSGKGNYFRHSGFNSGYLATMVGSNKNGNGVIIMVNTAPQDMSTTSIPQFDFLTAIVKKISEEENWN